MSQVTIHLPDHSTKVFDHEPTALEVAMSIGPRLAKDTLGAKINGSTEIRDLRAKLHDGDKIQLITTKSPEANDVIRHTAAHVMAHAVQDLYPDVKVTIGPVIENGFYYDFDSPFAMTEDHFAAIEKRMQEIIDENQAIKREEWPRERAIETFQKMGERFKVELIEGLKDEKEVGIYYNGEKWFDLCRGPHLQSTGQIKAFKLLSVAGAYWRGDEKNPMLQRVYATAFGDKKDLEQYLVNIEEAKRRDHRKLGKELGLFQFHELAPGSPFFTGKGSVIYTGLQEFMRDLYIEFGYKEVITPQIFDTQLFKTSGHMANYKDNMYFSKIDEREFGLKPMNCPSHCLMFGAEKHSYRELPLRMADFGRLHRYEKSGAMHGLTRVRTFCQDDAHVFCRKDQVQDEIQKFMQMLTKAYTTLGMPNFKVYLSTRPEQRIGTDEDWDRAESALSQALEHLNIPYTINPGDGAFYGPKLDIMFVDALNRPWQLGTLQYDPNLPERFDLTYVGDDNKDHRPIMLHRAILGSLERFIGVYLEHTAGHMPPFLSPVQVAILNITDRVNETCDQLMALMKEKKIRAEFDRRPEKLGYKIREAQLQKIPYMVVIGDKEAEKGEVTVRLRDGSQVTGLTHDRLIEWITNDVNNRRLTPTNPNGHDLKEVSH